MRNRTLNKLCQMLLSFQKNVEHVTEIAKLFHSRNVHMIPFGTGTGLEGGVTADRGGGVDKNGQNYRLEP